MSKLDIKMLLPYDESNKRPIVPKNYEKWLQFSNSLTIEFDDYDTKIKCEEFGYYLYIVHEHSNFIRYDIKKDIIYLWNAKKSKGKKVSKIKKFVKYCEDHDIKIRINEIEN